MDPFRSQGESIVTRALAPSDIESVAPLLDDSLGRGYWDLDVSQLGSHRAAVAFGAIVGVASAALVDALPGAPEYSAPIGLIRIVAVDSAFRGRGIATSLVREVDEGCEANGASIVAAYAWVHASTGRAPLAGVLARAGFVRARRLEGFYASAAADECRGCGRAPCVCPADLYVRDPGRALAAEKACG